MREIKFRAYFLGTMRYFEKPEDFKWFFGGTNGPERKLSECKLMQYTGLKDNTCKEIYDGDIVEINNHKYTVKFEIGSFMLVRCSDETDMYEQFENCWNDDVYLLSQYHWNSNADEDILYNLEVIGNIYENTDLIAKESEK